MVKSFPGLSFAEYIPHCMFAILWPVITILHFEPAGGSVGLPHGVV